MALHSLSQSNFFCFLFLQIVTYKMKDTFIIRTEWFESISELDDTEQAMIFRNLFHFHNEEENLINLNNRAVKLVWKLLEPNIKRNIDSYDEFGFPKSSMVAENHWNWKNGITTKNKAIRNSQKTKNWRKLVFTRDRFICQKCFKAGGILNAHHIKRFSKYPELRFDIDNGLTLCKKCHIELHKKEMN